MFDYSNLDAVLRQLNVSKSELGKMTGLSSRTIAKIAKGEKLTNSTLARIAGCLHCNPEDLYRIVSDNRLIQILRDEKGAGISGGIYHELQVRMAFNSNHIEGSRLTEDQTRMIFETNTVDTGDGIPVDDILETLHHFRAVDYCIDIAEDPLTAETIKKLHYILKHDTKDSTLGWFAVGDYKKRSNMVGGRKTVSPENVEKEMNSLISRYESLDSVNFDDIVEFHAEFEMIHPFQDGNGRVGRLIAFKECLRHNIVPFIIEDTKKNFYYRGLTEWRNEKGYLRDTCLDGQDTILALLKSLETEI